MKVNLKYVTVLLVLIVTVCSLFAQLPVQAAGQQYTVTYDANGGSDAPAAQTQYGVTTMTLSSSVPQRSGYVFKGWAISVYGEAQYNPGDRYTAHTDVTLYAVWYKVCSRCGGNGRVLSACSICRGNGYYVKERSSCCNAEVAHTIGNYGTSYTQCRSCGKICSVNKTRVECAPTQYATCGTCNGTKCEKTTLPTAPMPQLLHTDGKSITVAAAEGMQYSLDGKTWQNSNSFTELSNNTTYTVYQRYAPNRDYLAGEPSPGLTVNTGKITPAAPTAPTVNVICHDTIYLGSEQKYEYSIDKINWQADGIFENLEPDTAYTFYRRLKATATENASEVSPGVTVKTGKCGILEIESVIGAPGDTVTVDITMSENPGLNYLKLYLDYDGYSLEFVKVKDMGLLPGFSVDADNYSVNIVWDGTDGDNIIKTGVIATLTFRIKERPDTTALVTFFGYECWNKAAVNQGFICNDGTISVACSTHSFGRYSSDLENHWRTCTVCKYKEITPHEFKNSCASRCSVCNGYVRPSSHEIFVNKDETHHWEECAICQARTDKYAHIPGPEATDDTPQTCTECGYVIVPALGHSHEFDPNFTMDSQGHWHACNGCEEKREYAAHRFKDACSTECLDCGYTRQAAHSYSLQWTNDSQMHWHACSICGAKGDYAAHQPGPAATETDAQTCTVCGFEIAPALGNTATQPTATQPTATQPAVTQPAETQPKNEPASKGNQAVFWIAIPVISGIAGGAVVFLLLKKKNR